MKKLLFLLVLAFTIQCFSQELTTNFKEYSYSEFFKLLSEEQDSIFRLENALITFNSKTDSLFSVITDHYMQGNEVTRYRKSRLVIDKIIELQNVHFVSNIIIERDSIDSQLIRNGVFNNILFKRKIQIENSYSISFDNCEFQEDFSFRTGPSIESVWKFFEKENLSNATDGIGVYHSKFYGSVTATCFAVGIEPRLPASIQFLGNDFFAKSKNDTFNNEVYLFGRKIFSMGFSDNVIHNGINVFFNDIENESRIISKNKFNRAYFKLNLLGSRGFNSFNFSNNSFEKIVEIDIDKMYPTYTIDYSQFDKLLVSRDGIDSFVFSYEKELGTGFGIGSLGFKSKDSIFMQYQKKEKYRNLSSFNSDLALKGLFYNHFKSRFNNKEANLVYVEMKDMETERMKYEYEQTPSFEAFFTLKVNQFLKIFSAYGTKPSKAIIFSMYVILAFAFIYLLFPNSWDTLGNKRLMSRFEFFQKYLRRKDGMHTIYLEGKAQEISSFNDFKQNLDSAKLELPAFFISWSKPLYNASMFGSKIMTRFLKTTDVLAGKWIDLSPKQKRWKNIQIGFLLTIGLLYDIFIKILNALMLSINTFTTLGFGEIPIKGLPRYLAILQGFIGWFMLTIFSVSLISQLLN